MIAKTCILAFFTIFPLFAARQSLAHPNQEIATIIPIFMLIFPGTGARQLGFMEPRFTAPANRLVF